jgi:arylsulfatase A-like enzyme
MPWRRSRLAYRATLPTDRCHFNDAAIRIHREHRNIRWPGQIKPSTVENGLFSGLDWFPTLMAAAGNPNITDQLLKGVQLGDRTYKNHLDGYNQMDLLTGKGPSKRQELFYFWRRAARRGSHRKLQVHVLCAALRLAGRKDHDRHAVHR